MESIKELNCALRTLTIISLPGKECKDFSKSLPWFPIVGFLIGLTIYGFCLLWYFFGLRSWPEGAAVIIVFLEILLTRGLHLDGLADWADSLGGFYEREDRLAIMKDLRLGAFGVISIFVALAAKWVAFTRLLSAGSVVWFIAVLMISRAMMVDLITRLPYARKEPGMAQPFVEGATGRLCAVSHSLTLALCILFGPLGLGGYFLAFCLTRIFGWRCRKHFGGITGDLLGTSNELLEICLFMTLALPGDLINDYTGLKWLIQ